jgi:hypothetical protein
MFPDTLFMGYLMRQISHRLVYQGAGAGIDEHPSYGKTSRLDAKYSSIID